MNPNSIFSASDISRLKPLVSAETLAALEAIERDDYLPSVFTDTEGEQIGHETLCKISLKQWEFDALEQHVFQLGGRVFVPIGVDGWEGVFEADNIEEFLCQLDPGSAAIEDLLEAFGVAPTLDVAKRGCTDDCRIWIRHHYTNRELQAPSNTWAKDEDGKILEFESYSAASKWVKNADYEDHDWRTDLEPKGHYRYCNGELAPKEYIICKSWRPYLITG